MGTGAGGQGLGDLQTLAPGVVFPMYRDQGGNPETAQVLGAHFRARAFGAHHDHGDVLADLHAFFHQVEAVGVVQAGAVFHQRHHGADDVGVLLVRRQVHDHVGLGDQFLVGTDGKAVFGGVFPGLALFLNGFGAQGVGHIQARITQTQSLVQPLGAATDDDDFLAFEVVAAVAEFTAFHKPAFAELFQLQTQRETVEVVLSHGVLLWRRGRP